MPWPGRARTRMSTQRPAARAGTDTRGHDMSGPFGAFTKAAATEFQRVLVGGDGPVLGVDPDGVLKEVKDYVALAKAGVWGILVTKLGTETAETVQKVFIPSKARKHGQTPKNANHAEYRMLGRVSDHLGKADAAPAKFIFILNRGPCAACLETLELAVGGFAKCYGKTFRGLSVVYDGHYTEGEDSWSDGTEAIGKYKEVTDRLPGLRIRSLSQLAQQETAWKLKDKKTAWKVPLKVKVG